MRTWISVLAAIVLMGAAALALGPGPLQLSTDVRLVTAEAYVAASGKPMTNLTLEDFTVFEDGEPREIRAFSSAETAYNILLLFDGSSSTEDQWPFLERAIFRFINRLPDQDRVALAAFDDKPEMLVEWTSPRAFPNSFDFPSDNGGTDVYRAIEWAVGRFQGLKGRKGVIVLTDGVDNRLSGKLVRFDKDRIPSIAPPDTDADLKKMLRTVAQSGAQIYFVAVNTDLNPDPRSDPPGSFDLMQRAAGRLRMELTANQSGGLVHRPKHIDEVVSYYGEIGRALGHSYTLQFVPAKVAHDGTYHRIEVRVRDKTMNVTQLREGYFDR